MCKHSDFKEPNGEVKVKQGLGPSKLGVSGFSLTFGRVQDPSGGSLPTSNCLITSICMLTRTLSKTSNYRTNMEGYQKGRSCSTLCFCVIYFRLLTGPCWWRGPLFIVFYTEISVILSIKKSTILNFQLGYITIIDPFIDSL